LIIYKIQSLIEANVFYIHKCLRNRRDLLTLGGDLFQSNEILWDKIPHAAYAERVEVFIY